MAKKRKSTTAAPSLLTLIRGASSYAGARSFLGAPFVAAGLVLVLVTAYLLFRVYYVFAIGTFFGAMFLFSVAEISKVLFDLADCALLGEARARTRDAREARENYRANEPEY